MNLKYIQPKKLKVLIALFFGSAAMGIFVGLEMATGIQITLHHIFGCD